MRLRLKQIPLLVQIDLTSSTSSTLPFEALKQVRRPRAVLSPPRFTIAFAH